MGSLSFEFTILCSLSLGFNGKQISFSSICIIKGSSFVMCLQFCLCFFFWTSPYTISPHCNCCGTKAPLPFCVSDSPSVKLPQGETSGAEQTLRCDPPGHWQQSIFAALGLS